MLLFSSPVRHFVLLCFRDLAVNRFDFNFLCSISTFCTRWQLPALFGTNRRVLSRCVCWNFCIYIIKVKVATWRVNLTERRGVSWIREPATGFICLLKCTWPFYFLFSFRENLKICLKSCTQEERFKRFSIWSMTWNALWNVRDPWIFLELVRVCYPYHNASVSLLI